MPLYEHACTNRDCMKHFDVACKIDRRNEPRECPICDYPSERVMNAPMVSSFTPYRTVAHDKETGKTMKIRNRDEHAAFLRRNGYEEVGNDKSMNLPPPDERMRRRIEQLRDTSQNPIVFDYDPDTQEAKA